MPKSTDYSRMGLAQLLKTVTQTPAEKRQASARIAMTRRGVAKRRAKSQLVDPSLHGTVLSTSYTRGPLAAPLIASRWLGQDFIITVPWYIQRWADWPTGVALRHFKSDMRQGARALSTFALRAISADEDFGYDARIRPWLPELKDRLEGLGLVRLIPPRGKLFEEDSKIHWGHHMRDGIYDVFAGMKLDKNNNPIWLGQDADDNNRAGFIPFQYNQVHSDGHGVAFVYRFKPEALEQLRLVG